MLSQLQLLGMALDARAREQVAERCYASAHAQLERGNCGDSALLFGIALLLGARDGAGLLGLGATAEAAGNPGAALGLYCVGAELVPKNAVRFHLARARLLLRERARLQAREAFDEAQAAASDLELSRMIREERSRT